MKGSRSHRLRFAVGIVSVQVWLEIRGKLYEDYERIHTEAVQRS